MKPIELHCAGPPESETCCQDDAQLRFAAVCKALAHPVRVQIVQHLKQMNRCVCGRIVDVLPLAQSTVSQHLKILKASGLVRGEIEGPRTCYCLDTAVMAEFRTYMEQLFLTRL